MDEAVLQYAVVDRSNFHHPWLLQMQVPEDRAMTLRDGAAPADTPATLPEILKAIGEIRYHKIKFLNKTSKAQWATSASHNNHRVASSLGTVTEVL
jgi:hypothetical protein